MDAKFLIRTEIMFYVFNIFSECKVELKATETEQNFTSHAEFPLRPYANNLNCIWNIETEENFGIEITFVSLELEDRGFQGCYDFVQVRN